AGLCFPLRGRLGLASRCCVGAELISVAGRQVRRARCRDQILVVRLSLGTDLAVHISLPVVSWGACIPLFLCVWAGRWKCGGCVRVCGIVDQKNCGVLLRQGRGCVALPRVRWRAAPPFAAPPPYPTAALLPPIFLGEGVGGKQRSRVVCTVKRWNWTGVAHVMRQRGGATATVVVRAAAVVAGGAVSHRTMWRSFTRCRAYTPVGTVQDFTTSPHHVRLAEVQRELDEMSGHRVTHFYEGLTITMAHGPRPSSTI
ncbi:hypothetical protein TraAM80_09668, partial [Trypanosoma rangeli]